MVNSLKKDKSGLMKKIVVLLFLLTACSFGQEEYFGQNKVQYKNLDWFYIQTHNFTVYFNKGQDSTAVFAAKTLEDAYKIISEELNHNLTIRVPVILYSSPNDFQQTNIISDVLPEGVGGFTEIFKNRMVIPFDGSYEDLRHVLHHELTHAVVFNLLYGNQISSLLSGQAFFSPPLWYSEGYAEYSSRKGWDYEADMFMRDAVVSGYLPPLEELSGFLDYKGGQSALIYITDNYGKQRISEIFNKGKVLKTMNRAVKATLGMDMQKLSDGWQKELRRVYWPDISKRKTADETGRLLTNHKKDGSIYNMNPAWSPKGDRIAITSDRANPRDGFSDRFNEIYVISAVDGKIIDKVVRAERSGDLESLHAYFSGISWSPKGDKLVFISKSHGQDALFFLDVNTKKIYKRFRPKLEALKSPSWSPVGDKIILSGVKGGYSDLYVYDIATDNFSRLTFDRYDDIDAKFSPNGSTVAFASDRPVSGEADSTFTYGNYNIFLYDMLLNKITSLTNDSTKCIQPDFSPNGELLAYVSYRNGIANIYIHNFATGEQFPITDILSGAFSPSWSPEGDKIAVSMFDHYGYDIGIIKDIKSISEDKKLEPTSFRLTGRLFPKINMAVVTDTTKVIPRSDSTTSQIDYSRYVFKADDTGKPATSTKEDSLKTKADKTLATIEASLPDTMKYLEPDGSYKKSKYRPKFAPELVTGGFSYDTYYGLRGQSYMAFTDMMGNNQILLATDIFNAIDQSNIQVLYNYLAKRMDYSISAFHFKNVYYDNYKDLYFSDRLYGAMGQISYPLSKFNRIDLGLSQITIAREYLDYWGPPDSTKNLMAVGLAYVSDKVIWGIVGPVYGQRFKLSLEKSIKVASHGYSYTSFEVDFRKYFHFGSDYNFAFRFAGGLSRGKNPRNYNLGGTSNWISPHENSQEDIFGIQNIYVNKMIVPLRGYRYFEFRGKNFFLANFELRYPFIDYLKMRVPFGLTIGYVRGSLFYDIGAAFDRTQDFHFFDSKASSLKLYTPKSGVGFSIQSNLGLFVLRFDTAWRTDLFGVSKRPRYYFSFGANY
jgi:Tol biopolymer transport system component